MRTFLLSIFLLTATSATAQKIVTPAEHMKGTGIAMAVGGAVNMAVAATYLAINVKVLPQWRIKKHKR